MKIMAESYEGSFINILHIILLTGTAFACSRFYAMYKMGFFNKSKGEKTKLDFKRYGIY